MYWLNLHQTETHKFKKDLSSTTQFFSIINECDALFHVFITHSTQIKKEPKNIDEDFYAAERQKKDDSVPLGTGPNLL